MFTPFKGHEFFEHDFLVAGSFDRSHESTNFEDMPNCHFKTFALEAQDLLVCFPEFFGCWKILFGPSGEIFSC